MPVSPELKDHYNRRINYFRVSITDRCNLTCMYCMPHVLVPKLSHDDILSYEEILRIVAVSTRLGITKVRITGGEPLVRKGVYEFLGKLTTIKGLTDISLTTNGMLLADHAERIKSAGIHRINISLDSLNRKTYQHITGEDGFNQVWRGIEKAAQIGMNPIKLNVVILKGINDDEILDFARLSLTYPFHIRFIEYMTIGETSVHMGDAIFTPEIKERISTLGRLNAIGKGNNDGPAEIYQLDGAIGKIGFISALSNHFCHQCNRIRLTASGQLRPCLLTDDDEEDIKGPMRRGCSDQELAEIFRKAINRKPKGHQMTADHPVRISTRMSSIGG